MSTHPSGISQRYDIAKQVVEAHQFAPAPVPAFEGVALDVTTAHVIVTVLDCLSDANLAKVDGIPLQRFIDFVWAQVSR